MAELSAVNRRRIWRRVLILSGSALALSIAAGVLMFSTLMYYDDEGYVLISLRDFAAHGRLYREVFSQYGPFPFVFYSGLHALGLPFTHTAGRLFTLAVWAGTALASAAFIGRATRSLALQLVTLAGVFVYLLSMAHEPPHPGGLVALITALLAWRGAKAIAENRPTTWAWLTGAGIAALALTKINIGVFAACAALAWAAVHHEHPGVRRWSPLLLAAGAILLPFGLMRSLLGTDWVLEFATIFAVSALMALGAAMLAGTPRVGWRALGRGLLAGSAVVIVVTGIVLARGTTPADLLDGIVLRPMRHPVLFNLRFIWPPATISALAAAAGTFAVARWLHRRHAASVDVAIAVLRVAAASALAVALAQFAVQSPDQLVLAYLVPWTWLFLWPLTGEDASAVAAQRWVGLLFLGQCLHAFPVPGSQLAWGTFLAIPLALSGAWRAAGLLKQRFAPPAWLPRVLLAGAVAFALVLGLRFSETARDSRTGDDLQLPGAEILHPPALTAAIYRALDLNARAHGDLLFSLPGMFSFNLWSGLPTPTFANVTHWFSLLDEPEQRAIAQSLDAHPNAVLIVQRDHLAFLTQHGLAPRGLLYDELMNHFEKAFALGGFEFWVRRGRTVAPLATARLYHRTVGPDEYRLTVCALTAPDARISRLEWLETTHDRAPLPRFTLDARNCRLEITPLFSNGAPAGEPAEVSLPARPPRIARLTFVTSHPLATLPRRHGLLRLRGPDGELIAEAVFAD